MFSTVSFVGDNVSKTLNKELNLAGTQVSMLPPYNDIQHFSFLFFFFWSLQAYVVNTFEFSRQNTSVEICWWGDWFNQSLGLWFTFNHIILYGAKWWVSLLNLIILGPTSSTETYKWAPSQQYVDENYNGSANYLTANTCTEFYVLLCKFKTVLRKQQNDFDLCYYLWFAIKKGWVNCVRQFFPKNEQHSSY